MRFRRRRGQALVEFALVLPLLLALLVGIVDVSFVYNHQLLLTNAAREGARLGTMGHTADQVREDVLAYLTASGYVPLPADGDVAVTFTAEQIQVAVQSDVPWLFATFGKPITLAAATYMRREQ